MSTSFLKEKSSACVLPHRDEKSIHNFWSSQFVCHHFLITLHIHTSILSFIVFVYFLSLPMNKKILTAGVAFATIAVTTLTFA